MKFIRKFLYAKKRGERSGEKQEKKEILLWSLFCFRWLSVRLELVGSLVTFVSGLFAVLARDTLSAGLVALSVTYAIKVG